MHHGVRDAVVDTAEAVATRSSTAIPVVWVGVRIGVRIRVRAGWCSRSIVDVDGT